MKITRLVIIQYILFVILGLWVNVIQARFQISPMVIETNTIKGMASGMIEVKNLGSETVRLQVYSEPFTYNLNGFEPLETSPQDLTHYLVYAPRQLTIQPGQKRRIRLNVRFLPSTKPGEYRAMVFTQTVKSSTSGNASQMGIIPRIGTAVFVRHGDVKPQLSVQESTYKNKHIRLRVNNTGQATARPHVNWILTQSGQEIAAGNSNKQTVIAEGQRHLKIGDQNSAIESLQAGSYQIKGELVWGVKNANSLPFEQQFVVP